MPLKKGSFLSPKLDKRFFIRLSATALAAYLFFGYICVPTYIKGESMEPTYNRTGFDFCWRPAFWFATPARGDIVVIRYTGPKLYLKRVVALSGETVEFKNGKLLVDGAPADEPYVKKNCDWNLPPRVVPNGRIYVVGDNRSMSMELHKFGAVKLERIYGAPLW